MENEKIDIKVLRESLKPVGDPDDWENNDDYMHPDNFRIRLFNMLDDVTHYLKTGDRSMIITEDEFMKELEELAELHEKEEHSTIEELFEGFEGDYEPVEIDWGKPQGNELW
ncbi:MAG: hypothetical protein LBM87_07145 [Ruminococcus sp.]|jgi:hypothetical protein|nr:hypothetical protein [Ruminococcus sp.]